MSKQPLAEVFGFPIDNLTSVARYHRENRLCPYSNRVPNCTKDKANDPLGVCSVYEGDHAVITCPVRFRQNWMIAADAASFFFPRGRRWTSLTEVRLEDKHGRSAGNIDVVLVAYDDRGQVVDFGALEVQAVYISGNVRRPFEHYMENPKGHCDMEWAGQLYPRPDYLSSSRKRLAPQLIHKGGILHTWGKKLAVAADRHFFASLPSLPETTQEHAEIVWLVYDLALDSRENRYNLSVHQRTYTFFEAALESITKAEAGPVEEFLKQLQTKLDEKLETASPPDAPILFEPIEE